jgi:hypothetical protein
MPPFGMYAITAPRLAAPRAPAHSNPTARKSHTSQNDVDATRRGLSGPYQGRVSLDAFLSAGLIPQAGLLKLLP